MARGDACAHAATPFEVGADSLARGVTNPYLGSLGTPLTAMMRSRSEWVAKPDAGISKAIVEAREDEVPHDLPYFDPPLRANGSRSAGRPALAPTWLSDPVWRVLDAAGGGRGGG